MTSTGIIESRPVTERPPVLRITRFALLLVMTYTAIADTSRAISTVTGLHLASGTDPRLPLIDLPQLVQADLRAGSTGTLADADLILRILGAVPSVIHGVTVVLAIAWLLRALRGIAQGQPFHAFVVQNWRRLALTLLAGGLAQGVADGIACTYLAVGAGFRGISFLGAVGGGSSRTDPQQVAFLGGDYEAISVASATWPVDLLLAGLVALALTAAFRAGARLAEDADGVV